MNNFLMKHNKGSVRTWLPIITGVIIVVLIGGIILAYQYWVAPKEEVEAPAPTKKEEGPIVTTDEQKLAEETVIEYEDGLKTRERDKVLPYTAGELKEQVQEWPPVFGTSNPRSGGAEILTSRKINDAEFEVKARHFEEYLGEGRIGYNDNTYTVKKIGDQYFITSIEYGEYIEITD